MAKGAGTIGMIAGQLTQFRNSLEIAKAANNYFVMCQTLLELGNILPVEAEYNKKPFREYWDQAEKECPQCIYHKDQLDMTDKKAIRIWYAKHSKIVLRVIADYVKDFYDRGRDSSL